MLSDLGHSWVTHSTKADLSKTTHTSVFSFATTWKKPLQPPVPCQSLKNPSCFLSYQNASIWSSISKRAAYSSFKDDKQCGMFTLSLLVRDLSFLLWVTEQNIPLAPSHTFHHNQLCIGGLLYQPYPKLGKSQTTYQWVFRKQINLRTETLLHIDVNRTSRSQELMNIILVPSLPTIDIPPPFLQDWRHGTEVQKCI